MDCPHCGAETLMGATTCMACGKPMFARAGHDARSRTASKLKEPPPEPSGSNPQAREADERTGTEASAPVRPRLADEGSLPPRLALGDDAGGDALPPPVTLSPRPRRTLCRICMGPCSDLLTNVCMACQSGAAATATQDDSAAGFSKKFGTSAFRPPPPRRTRSAGARALRAIFWGIVLVGAGFGVVRFTAPPEPGAILAEDSSAAAVTVAFEMPRDSVLHYTTTLDVQILREEIPSAFDSTTMTIFDLHQVSEHSAEVMLVRNEGTGALLDVRTVCRLTSQDGEWEQKDGSTRPVYPWSDHIDTIRVRVAPGEHAAQRDGREPMPARDIPPLLTFGHAGGPVERLRPGARWTTDAMLPCLATRGGALAPSPFSCDLRYVGRRVLDGRACAIVRLRATPKRPLDDRFDTLDGAGGDVRGALAYDVDSGLLVSADLQVDTNARRGSPSSPDERVSLTGTLRVTRR